LYSYITRCYLLLPDPFQEAQGSRFKGVNVAMTTAPLWGRRIHHVAVSESVVFALSDTGDLYCWGGNNFWWHEIQPGLLSLSLSLSLSLIDVESLADLMI
jgi:hypothetical protein